MLKKDNFFKNYFINLSKYNKNLKKTKKVFSSFLVDLKNNQIPLLKSYEKNYEFDFSATTVKKFSKYRNIVVIGMGGSILGTKSIYANLIALIIRCSVGKLFDRIYYYAVPDFIDLHLGNYHWFIFNVADIFITAGIIGLILVELLKKEKIPENV